MFPVNTQYPYRLGFLRINELRLGQTRCANGVRFEIKFKLESKKIKTLINTKYVFQTYCATTNVICYYTACYTFMNRVIRVTFDGCVLSDKTLVKLKNKTTILYDHSETVVQVLTVVRLTEK